MRKAFWLALLTLLLCGCTQTGANPGNYPYEPDTPAPAVHEGVFTSEHGTMTFSGDGESIVIDFDTMLAELTGLPEGAQEGTYVFLSGNLPPHGSFPVRYDIAHELQITVGEQSAVIDMGLASEDGRSGTAGVDTVTPERIPMLFSGDRFFSVVFQKEDGRSVEHFFFQESNGSDYDRWAVYQLDFEYGSYTAVIKPEGVKEEDARTLNVDKRFSRQLGSILRAYDVASWNGFDRKDTAVTDGIGFTLRIVLSDGTEIEATGYMEWPERYNTAADKVHELFLDAYQTVG